VEQHPFRHLNEDQFSQSASHPERPSPPANPPNSTRRLVHFVIGLLLLFAGLELLVRRNATLFEAASHRALAKVAMFKQHPRVDILFLGTSRTQDGVSPDLVTRALGEIAPDLGPLPGYNAAFTGSSLDALLALVPRFGYRSGLRAVVIELSVPQIFNEPVPWEESDAPVLTVEDKLGEVMHSLYFVRYRKAFLSDNLGRLPALLIFGPSLGGWETRTKDQIGSWLGRKETAAAGFDATLWKPELFLPVASPQTLVAKDETIATQLATVAREFKQHGIKVTFAVPPMTHGFQFAPERDKLKPLFSEVARRGGCEVWNFATLSLPDPLFRDPSHLGTEGRAHYSRALAIQVARILKEP
jgi:hypothetical protein